MCRVSCGLACSAAKVDLKQNIVLLLGYRVVSKQQSANEWHQLALGAPSLGVGFR